MRAIKFRAWNEKTKEMLYDIIGVCSGHPIQPDGTGYYHSLKCMPVMQFTGLEDRQGKEIFESDIVKLAYGTKGLGVIEWYIDSFRVKTDSFVPNNQIIAGWLEVIGDIYGNPKLMEKEKKNDENN